MTARGLVLVALIVLVGCGSDGDSGTGPSTTPTAAGGGASSVVSTESSTSATVPECTDDSLAGGTVSTVGFDEITFGMTVVEAETASGVCLAADRPINDECYYVRPLPGPDGVAFLVSEGTIERVDVDAGPVTVRSGFGIGSAEQDVVDEFGENLRVVANPAGVGNQLVFVPTDEADAEFRVIFETDGEAVISFRSGRVPQIEESVTCDGPGPVADDVSLD